MNCCAIPTKNIEESRRFYEKIGFVVSHLWKKEDQRLEACVMRDASGFETELVYHPENVHITLPEHPIVLHLALEVARIEETIAKYGNDIVVVLPIRQGKTVCRFAFIRDPSGFAVELFER